MIPKSVSVSTRTLVLGVVLVCPVWGWAGEEWHIDAAGSSQWRCTKDKATCEVWTATHLRLHEQLCSQRMREAMRLWDAYVKGQDDFVVRRAPKEHRQLWEKTMKDCVEGGK